MYCRECGNQVSGKTKICPNCGVRPLNGTNYCQSCGMGTKKEQELCVSCGASLAPLVRRLNYGEDKPSGVVKLLSFIFPILGVVLYFIWKDMKPNSAKSVCMWSITGWLISIAYYFISHLLGPSLNEITAIVVFDSFGMHI